MLKRTLFFALIFALINILCLEASVSMGPQFFIRAKVHSIGLKTVYDASGVAFTNNYLEFEVLGFESGSSSRFSAGDIRHVKLNKKNNSLFKKDDEIILGVEIGSTMSPTGPLEFMIYSPVKDITGRIIIDRLF